MSKENSIPKTVLIAASPPGNSNVDGVFLGEMLQCVDRQAIALAAVCESSAVQDVTLGRFAACKSFVSPNEFFPADPRLQSRVRCAIRHATVFRRRMKAVAADVNDFIGDQKPEQIWCILTSLAAIEVAWNLSAVVKCPLLVQAWDDPLHLMHNRRLDRLNRTRTMRVFHDLLGRAERVAVIGEAMRDRYRRYTKNVPIIVRHGLTDNVVAKSSVCEESEFRIGFCGGMYAGSAWQCLQSALEVLNWRIAGRNIVLVVTSPRIELTATQPARTRYHGWQSKGESAANCIQRSVELMADCDLLYLPQGFDSVSRSLTELSFPSKLSTYATTGRPILVHTPFYGSLNQFCREHNFGLVCNELNAERLAELLTSAAQNDHRMKELACQTAHIGSSVLSRQQFVDSVRSFVGLSEQP